MSTIDRHILPPRTRVIRMVRTLADSGQLKPGDQISSERALAEQLGIGRGAVRGALAELRRAGLLQNTIGRGLCLAGKQATGLMSRCIVVLTPTPEPSSDHNSVGWAEHIAQGAINAVRLSGRNPMVIDPTSVDHSQISALLADPPAGVLCPEIPDQQYMPVDVLNQFVDAGMPLVVYGGAPELLRFDRVRSDHCAGAYELTKYLISRGCTRIVIYWADGIENYYWGQGRLAGYEKAMREAGLKPMPTHRHVGGRLHIPGMAAPDEFEFRVRFHMGCLMPLFASANPEALMLVSDGLVPEVAKACSHLGHEPGSDLLLAGYDDYWAESETRPFLADVAPAASVGKRNRAAGEEMVRLLLDRIDGKLPAEPQERVVRPELVVL